MTAFARRAVWRFAAAMALAGGPALACAGPPAALTVSVVPQFPAEDIYRDWVPVLRRISALSGVPLQLAVSASIPHFEQSFAAGTADLLFLNPYHAVMAKRSAGYEPILCDASQRLTGILVVRKDAAVRDVAGLDGAHIAFPAPHAFGASLYMRALLHEREHLRFQARYAGTHSNVFRQVISGEVAAGGAVRHTLALEAPQLRGQLRILYETPASEPHPLAAHPRVPAAVRAQLQQAFLALARDAAGRALLGKVQLERPRLSSYADYQPLERLGLEKYLLSAPAAPAAP